MSIRALLCCVTALFVVGASTLTAKADTLTLESDSGNTYIYGLTVNFVDWGFTFEGQPLYQPDFTSLEITGLAGVTGVTVSEDLASYLHLTCGFTSNQIDCSSSGSFNLMFFSEPVVLSDLSITSTSAPGTVAFSIVDSSGDSGSIIGPAASSGPPASPTPEPSAFVLVGTGVATTLWARRRRVAI
jgi:PEP-CTERM motif